MHSGQRHIKAEQMRQMMYERIKRLLQADVTLDEGQDAQVKEIVQRLYNNLQQIFIIPDWQQRGKGQVFNEARVMIEDALLHLPRSIYPRELYRQRCDDVFLHIQTHNKGDEETDVA